MSIKKSLVQISTEKLKESTDTIFKIKNLKHTPYAFEFKRFNINSSDYDSPISFDIPLNGSLLYRCFFEVNIPNINLTDNIIKKKNQEFYNNYIKKSKNIILEKYQNHINKWETLFINFKKYSNIQIEIYVEIIKNLKIDNITIDNIKENISTIKEKYNDIYVNISSGIINYIVPETDIFEYITRITNDISVSDIEKNVNIKFKNINNYLEYYYNNKLYYQNLYDNKNQGKIFYKWIDNLAHYYLTEFTFLIDNNDIDSYSNDYLHIKQNHSIYSDNYINYNKVIRNNDSLYNNDYYKKKMYIPLLFGFCTEGTNNALPIIALTNSTLSIKSKINELEKLIYFQDWEEDFYNNLIIDIHREDHKNININNNIIKEKFEPFNPSVDLILPQHIYRYKFNKINKFILDHNYNGINSTDILTKYGTLDDTNGELVMDLDEWIYMKNNLKSNNNIPEATKILLLDYHYFIEYSWLLDLIPPPEIYLNLEYGYLDNIENHIFAKYPLRYIIQTRYEQVIETNNSSFNKTLDIVPDSIKELYVFIQPKLSVNGYNTYSKSKLSNYDIKTLIDPEIMSELKLIVYNEYNLLAFNNGGFNDVVNLLFLKSQLPKGVYYKNFSISPETYQPSGNINLSSVNSGHKIILEFDNDLFNKYINNKNNIGKLGIQGKIIYVTYKSLDILNGEVYHYT